MTSLSDRIDEFALEKAVIGHFDSLLPELAGQGYRVAEQQAVLLGRRLDVVLRRADGAVCILELKAAEPRMPETALQILDYAKVWRTSYGKEPALALASTRVSAAARKQLREMDIESYEISARKIREVLEHATAARIPRNTKLVPSDVEAVRALLSDFSVLEPPARYAPSPPWNHEKFFYALVERGMHSKDLWKKNPYVCLYPQKPLCAILYSSKSSNNVLQSGPLHLNENKSSWRPDVFERLASFIDRRFTDTKGFVWCHVTDWDAFADALGLNRQK